MLLVMIFGLANGMDFIEKVSSLVLRIKLNVVSIVEKFLVNKPTYGLKVKIPFHIIFMFVMIMCLE